MHISSLPSEFGIGKLGDSAYMFANFLRDCGVQVWQILPLSPTSYGDSPYQSFSVHAGNPYFIDFQRLEKKGYLAPPDYADINWGDDPRRVDYARVYNYCFHVLRTAYSRFRKDDPGYLTFCEAQKAWLPEYALFMALKDAHEGKPWHQWEPELAQRDPKALGKAKETYSDQIDFYSVLQYWFYQQWGELKTYCNLNGISIVGDIPIYVAFDSSDAWANPELFQFDEDCEPVAVAGCPPDAFSATGQLWGNPLYNWEHHKETGYAWWMQRLAACFERYDVVRIDHFRGFDAYYAIPYGEPTAEHGHWEQGPGYDIFRAMKEKLGEKEVIAEDLGFLTPSVIELVKKSGYPGMKILQFAFDSREESDYLPHNYTHNCVVYTGTHDNDTVMGWYDTLKGADKKLCDDYLRLKNADGEPIPREQLPWEFVRAAMSSVADLAIIPMQDYLELDSSARINTPSTLGCNWKWRMDKDALDPKLAKKIYRMAKLYGRL